MRRHKMNGNYGVTRDINAKMVMAGFLLWKLLVVVVALVIAFLTMGKIFPTNGWWKYAQILYLFLTPMWVGYLLLPVFSGKTILWAFWLAIRRKRQFYRSFQK